MREFKAVNILDLLENVGGEELEELISSFNCPLNLEIHDFVINKSLEFARKKLSVTYFVINEDGKICGIFTLAHKVVKIEEKNLTNSKKKKVARYATIDNNSEGYTVSAFLIAQFGKNYADNLDKDISGNELMDVTLQALKKVQHDIGGGIVYLECEDKPELLDFYQNDHNGFVKFGERFSDKDHVKYVQLLAIL